MTCQTVADFASVETLAIAMYESRVRGEGSRGQSMDTTIFIQANYAEWFDLTPEDRQHWRVQAHAMIREAKDHA